MGVSQDLLCGAVNKCDKMIEISEFKGHKVLKLMRSIEDKYPMSFGLQKAKLIMENLEEIKKFIEENDNEQVEA